MKKLLIIVCAFLWMIVLIGCNKQVVDTSVSKTADIAEENIKVSVSSSDYDTTKELLDVPSKNTKIYYPKLQGYKGELIMDYMNQSIKEIAEFYANGENYSDMHLDYEVKKMDKKIVSILFKGTGKFNETKNIIIQKSINLDAKSANPIVYENFIKQDEKNYPVLRQLLDEKAKNQGIMKGFEAEGVSIYFEGEHVVFFYMPLDDDARDWVELSIPLKELDGLINTEFGERPAS